MKELRNAILISMFLFLQMATSICQDKIENSVSLDTLRFNISTYEEISVTSNGENLDLMKGNFHFEEFGKLETKTANYFPIEIS